MKEPRSWWLLRLESIVYVLVGAVAILAFSFLVVLAPADLAKLISVRAGAGAFRRPDHLRALRGGGGRC